MSLESGSITPNGDRINDWNSQLLSLSDCLQDEENLWFGGWCCWIINSRNVQRFNLGNSFKENCYFWFAIFVFILFFKVNLLLAILFGIFIIIFFAYRRAQHRTQIRQKLSIPGTFSADFLAHTACSFCAICQESREANQAQLPKIDYCFGEPLVARDEAHEMAIQLNNSNTNISR
jgi:Cys-rich protein (TIGR01571 family)